MAHGYDIHAAKTSIPSLIKTNGGLGDPTQVYSYPPLWAWSDSEPFFLCGNFGFEEKISANLVDRS